MASTKKPKTGPTNLDPSIESVDAAWFAEFKSAKETLLKKEALLKKNAAADLKAADWWKSVVTGGAYKFGLDVSQGTDSGTDSPTFIDTGGATYEYEPATDTYKNNATGEVLTSEAMSGKMPEIMWSTGPPPLSAKAEQKQQELIYLDQGYTWYSKNYKSLKAMTATDCSCSQCKIESWNHLCDKYGKPALKVDYHDNPWKDYDNALDTEAKAKKPKVPKKVKPLKKYKGAPNFGLPHPQQHPPATRPKIGTGIYWWRVAVVSTVNSHVEAALVASRTRGSAEVEAKAQVTTCYKALGLDKSCLWDGTWKDQLKVLKAERLGVFRGMKSKPKNWQKTAKTKKAAG
jgi:hypothetical protein